MTNSFIFYILIIYCDGSSGVYFIPVVLYHKIIQFIYMKFNIWAYNLEIQFI